MVKPQDVFPKTINGVVYASKEELEKRMQADAQALAHLAYDMYQIHKRLEARLEREPQGFAFPAEGRICKICMGGGSGDFWYDKKGMRCMDCQTACNKKVVPAYIFTDDNNRRHITETGLVVRYKADRKEIKKHIKDGVLKPRLIDHGKFPPTLVFLKNENPNLAIWGDASGRPVAS